MSQSIDHGGRAGDTVVRPQSPIYGSPNLELVREGMRVVDAAGDEIGTVAHVQMGDPEAASLQGNDFDDPSLLAQIGGAIFGDTGEPDLPRPRRAQLMREGFLKVDAPGLFGADRYVAAKHVGSVDGDRVRLTVHRDALAVAD